MADDQFDPAELVEVFAGMDSLQVNMARDFLTEGGIESFLFDDKSSQMLGSTAAVPTRLMVHADRADEARQRLQELGFVS